MMRESQIVAQIGPHWIADANRQYTVYTDGVTAAKADSSYPRTQDGLSLARARLAYLAGIDLKFAPGRVGRL